MELIVIRHAQAEDDSLTGRDYDRALTDKGRRQAKDVGAHLASLGRVPELILTSPLVRARETARLVAESAGAAEPMQEGWLSCGMGPEVAMNELAAYQSFGRVALVGHQPDLGILIETLLGCPGGSIRVRKAQSFILETNAGLNRAVLQAALPWQYLGR